MATLDAVNEANFESDTAEWSKFLESWKHPNRYGIPEVPWDDIEFGDNLGKGKKSSTRKAKWNGMDVAVKYWMDTDLDDGPLSEWEIMVYHYMKEYQGTLVPKLFFVSRHPEGRRALGMELGQPTIRARQGEMDELMRKLKRAGWKQRDGSWRSDNVVYMKNDDGSKRLVAIDLESFIPHFRFDEAKLLKQPYEYFCGLPLVPPSEVYIEDCSHCWEWEVSSMFSDAMWGSQPVTLFATQSEKIYAIIERFHSFTHVQGKLIPKPLFLSRTRFGKITIGFAGAFDRFCPGVHEDKKVQELIQGLSAEGWDVPARAAIGYSPFVKCNDDAESLMFFSIDALVEKEVPDGEQLSDESSSSDCSDEEASRTRSQMKDTMGIAHRMKHLKLEMIAHQSKP